MKKIILISLLSLISIGTILTSCKKRKEFKKETGQISEDNKNIQSNVDGGVNDANIAISNNNLMSGRTSQGSAIQALTVCGATVDTTQRAQGILTLTYDGTTVCEGRKRSGVIKVTLQNYVNGTRWKDAGAVLQLDYTNYKVVRTSDSKSLTFNGSHTITNVNGGNFVMLVFAVSPSLVYKVEGSNIIVTFDDNTQSTFNLSRQYTYTYANSIFTVKGEGKGTQNGLNDLENWGTTRDGDNFTSQVTTPVIWNSTCTWSKPLSGKLNIKVDAKNFDLVTTFGVDASGNAVNSGCPWGLKVEWTYNNNTGSKLYQYN